MTYRPESDFGLETSLGHVAGYATVNKFGQALDCDNGVLTDIWDGADGATSTDIWVAPTVARTHDIASTVAADAAAGTGMRTVRVYGLQTWDSEQTSEDITLNGTTNVATANSYVIIHRMTGLTFGSGGTNAGIITATAQTDATVTAAVQTGEGQTLMVIYGVPSTQTLSLKGFGAGLLRLVGSSPTADCRLLVKLNADQSDAGFVTKHKFYISSTLGAFRREYLVPKTFAGPCIIKIQLTSDTNNSIAVGHFDAYLVDK